MLANLLLLAALQAAPAHIDDLGWLVGTWRGKDEDGTNEETWLPALGRSMVGVNRAVAGDALVFSEHMSIEETPDGLVLLMHHYGRGQVGWDREGVQPMRCVAALRGPGHVTFSGMEAVGPVAITYDVAQDGHLKIVVTAAKGTYSFDLERVR
jgi:hypothetical protein